jgi:hypothetical protein
MNTRRTRLLASMALAAVAAAPLANAADFYPITDIAAPNMIEGAPGTNPLTNVIEGPGVGYDAAEPHDRLGGTYYTDAPGGFPSDYIEANPGPEEIILDLGSDNVLGEMSYWGYSATNGNGIREFTLSFATDAESGGAGLGDESYGGSVSFNPMFEATNDDFARQIFDFGEFVVARYVKVTVLSNYFGIVVGGDRIGVGEIAFAQVVISDDPTLSVELDIELALTAQVEVFDIPIANIGDAELLNINYSFNGANAAAFSVPSGPASIPSLANDFFELQFDPTGLLGPVSATLEITSNDPNSPAEINLTGTVPPTDQNIVVPASIDRGQLLAIDNFAVNVQNTGGTALNIVGTNITGPDAGLFSVTAAPASIPAVSNADIQIELDPAGADGPISATLQISSDDPDTPTAEVMLTAEGLGGPDLVVPAPLIDRGRSSGVRTLAFNLRNAGGFELSISGATFTGADAAAFSVTNTPATIAPQDFEKIEVQIDTTGRSGPMSATLQIMSDDTDSPTTEVEIAAFAINEPDTFHTIDSVTASTDANDLWPSSNLIQGPDVGFSAALPHERLLGGAEGNWVTAAPGGFPSDFIAEAGMPTVVFDLGQDQPVNEISIWGYADTNSNGLSMFSLRFATASDGADGFGNSIGYNPTFSSIDLGLLPNEDMVSRESFTFEESAFARYVELTCIDNHFIAPGDNSEGNLPGGDRVGIGEVAFAVIDGPGATFAIVSIVRLSPTQIEIEFTSSAGATYAIDRSPDLVDWGNELDDGITGEQDTTTFLDSGVPAEAEEIFYRVRRL